MTTEPQLIHFLCWISLFANHTQVNYMILANLLWIQILFHPLSVKAIYGCFTSLFANPIWKCRCHHAMAILYTILSSNWQAVMQNFVFVRLTPILGWRWQKPFCFFPIGKWRGSQGCRPPMTKDIKILVDFQLENIDSMGKIADLMVFNYRQPIEFE